MINNYDYIFKIVRFIAVIFLIEIQSIHKFGSWYSGVVFINQTANFHFDFIPSVETTKTIRVTVRSENAPVLKPILVVIKQERNVVSFQVPSSHDSKYYYRQVSRTLCPEAFELSKRNSTKQVVFIELSSFVPENEASNFTMMAEVIEDFQLGYQRRKEINVGTSEPQYYYFEYPKGIDSVVVKLSSDTEQCLIFSVQKAQCPIEDSIGNVMFSGIYQSVTTQGAITITSRQMPERFVVVLVLRPSDYYCNGIENIIPIPDTKLEISELRRKPINITIDSTLDRESYVVPIVGAFMFYLTFYVAAGIIAYVYHTYDINIKYNIEKFEEEANDFPNDPNEEKSENVNKYGTMSASRQSFNNEDDELRQSLLYDSNDIESHNDDSNNTKKRNTNRFDDHQIVIQGSYNTSSLNPNISNNNITCCSNNTSNRNAEIDIKNEKKHHRKTNSLTEFVFNSGIGRHGPVMSHGRIKKSRQVSEKQNYNNAHRQVGGRKGLFSSSSEEFEDFEENSNCKLDFSNNLIDVSSNLESSRYNNTHYYLKTALSQSNDSMHLEANLHPASESNFTCSQEKEPHCYLNGNNEIYDSVVKSTPFSHASYEIGHLDSSHKELFNRMNGTIYVSDLSKKRYSSLSRKYLLYFWYLIIISIFYGLPVAQLVMTYQEAIHNTGNEDLCYYNFQCAHPLGIFISFNNIISNIGYIMLGILFLCLTFRRDIIQRRNHRNSRHHQKLQTNKKEEGIPQHYGLYYAMGAALLMEGLMSGCYHICPSFSNFQFDTAYMYILALILMLKIYQTRHPDVNASAHSAYMVMAMVILLGFTGVVYGGETFWIIFTIVFLLMSICLTAEIYYMGQWNFDICLPRRLYHLIRTDGLSCFRPMYRERMLLLLVVNCVNCGLASYGNFARPKDFSSYLLSLFLINLLMYFAFYIVMKLRHNEKILFLPLIYLIVASISWGFSLYFFINMTTSWQVSPAQSRAYNKACILFDFYDTHDVWHFLSSMSMFFSFMGLMNLDDDIINIPRSEIYVF